MTHPFLMVWLLLMIRFEFVYVYFIATKNVGDYSYMSSPNIYYRAKKDYLHLCITHKISSLFCSIILFVFTNYYRTYTWYS